MTTTNLGMTLPTVGADADTWGNELNTGLGLIDAAFAPVRYRNFTNATTFTATTNTLKMGGYGSSWTATPTRGTKLRITVTGYITANSSTNTALFNLRYGTGTAPAQGDAVTGSGGTTTDYLATPNAANSFIPFVMQYEATGLTLSTVYWFDVTMRSSPSNTATMTPISVVIEEVF
jgi:hypothetical protein